ncbi:MULTISPECIES: hypothetical protein [unclassified Mesorhizobium]|uniref:hypothetical protein n=1 Tax=unclassified Mesorhizobium TaxID=325217 RepID=UPI00301585A3
MTINKTLLSAVGMAVALTFSAPVLTATSANAAGATMAQPSTTATTPLVKKATLKKPVHHKKVSHKKHKKHAKKAAPKTETPAVQ